MKLVHITVRFEFTDDIEAILDRHGVGQFVRIPMAEAMDRDGKHFGNKTYPGSGSLVQALVDDAAVGPLLEDLRGFKEGKESHRHLRAVVLGIESAV
jgi:hypothetical protein